MPLTPYPIGAEPTSQTLILSCHPALTCDVQLVIQARFHVQTAEHNPWLGLQFELLGDVDRIHLPPKTSDGPADGLWQHTCAELFVRTANSPAYQEFNFSPSGQWAAYRFSSERQRNPQSEAEHPAVPPVIHVLGADASISIEIRLPLRNLARDTGAEGLLLGLSMVTELSNDEMSYWALHHPRADRPDFHHPDGCVLPLSLPPSPTPFR